MNLENRICLLPNYVKKVSTCIEAVYVAAVNDRYVIVLAVLTLATVLENLETGNHKLLCWFYWSLRSGTAGLGNRRYCVE